APPLPSLGAGRPWAGRRESALVRSGAPRYKPPSRPPLVPSRQARAPGLCTLPCLRTRSKGVAMRCPAVLLALCAALPCCGCLCVYTCEEPLRGDEPKRTVHFQSETAARLFCTTVDLRQKSGREEHTEEFYIPFLTSITRTRKLSEAAFYNDQAAVCDTDGDGMITDAEAV